MSYVQKPIEVREELEIFVKYNPEHRYQMGVDSAEGSEKGDEASITIADLTTLEEVASWSGRVPPDVTAEYAMKFARWYQNDKNKCVIVPEINSIGLATLNVLLKDQGLRITLSVTFFFSQNANSVETTLSS